MKSVLLAAFTASVCVTHTSCVKDPNNGQGQQEIETFNEFDFSTKKQVEFTLQYNVQPGYQVYFEMYAKSPLTLDKFKSYVKDSTLTPFLAGKSNGNGKITFKGELPATVDEIYSYSTAIGVPVLMKATVSDAGVVSNFTAVEVTSIETRSTRATDDGASGTNSWTTYSIKLDKPTLPAVSRDITLEDKNLIDLSFPENQNYDLVKSYYQPSIKLNSEATVKIYSVKHAANSNRTNALAYFTFMGDVKNVRPADVNPNMKLVFPELTKTLPAEGAGYQLLYNGETTFPANSNIGFALLPDITPGNIATDNIHLFYSCFNNGIWNSYSYPATGNGNGLFRANVPHMVLSLLRVDADGHAIIAIAFEDQPFSLNNGTNKGNFRDDIFIIEVDPATSLPDLPTHPTEKPDYDQEFKSAGIISFEDCWPHVGDYDMNDVVVSYERSLLYSNTKGLVGIKEIFTFLNNGAQFSNGFGYQFNGASKSNISKCTVESSYQCNGQGLDQTAPENEAIIMLFDNGKNVPKGTVFTVNTQLTEGTLILNINPFIVVEKSGGANDMLMKDRMEVHLPTLPGSNIMTRFLPTSKSGSNHFGTFADKSVVKNKVYYVRSGNYPFALEINWDLSKYGSFSQFMIPKETKSIDLSYPDFTKWVDSNGKTNKDWFLYPNTNL